jgi:hypothetical protein
VIVEDPPTEPNHFKVYDVDDQAVFLPADLLLTDQFPPEVLVPGFDPLDLDLFANPVDKNGEGIGDPDEHQRWYRLEDPEPTQASQVTYTNQFGTQKLRVGDPRYLVVPSQKDPHAPPEPTNHYQCYEVTWAPHKNKRIVQLDDQFGAEADVEVGDPRYFCNPVEKVVDPFGNPVFYPIRDPDNHLVCYDIEPKVDHDLFVTTLDQFGPATLNVHTNELLCVPSVKEGWGVPTMGRWGFATLVGLLMLTTAAWLAYRRRPLEGG